MTPIPNGLKSILAVYGKAGTCLETITTPHFRACPSRKIRVHRLISHELLEILWAIHAQEIELGRELVRSIDGCYAYRCKTGSASQLSTHAWGIAIDINAATNGYGRKPNQPTEIIAAFNSRGWTWGGRWRKPDGMHFQRARGY